MQGDYADVYNSQATSTDVPPGAAGASLNPGDPGTYYGSDNVWYGPDGTPLANQGRSPTAAPPTATVPPAGNVPVNGAPNVTQPPPATGAGPGPGPSIGTGALANFGEAAPGFPQMAPFAYKAFSAPTIEDAAKNPGYQFRVQQGEQGLQNWAAARGTLNDSGTAKALIDYGQAAGAQGYGEVYARDLSDYQTNLNAAQQTYGMNRTTQSIDPWTAAYNAWTQRGNWYLQNQGTVANAALSFANL